MHRIGTIVMGVCAALMIGSVAHAELTLNSVRIAAADTVALARFYQSAFAMQEVNRIAVPAGPEIFVNFGGTVDAAKANRGLPIVIMHRDSDATRRSPATSSPRPTWPPPSRRSRRRAARWMANPAHSEIPA